MSSPFLRERLSMRAGVVCSALVFLPVLWRAPEPVPLVTPVIFVPFLAGFVLARWLRRRWPLLSVLASRAATIMYLALLVATPLLYPRSFPIGPGHAVPAYLGWSAALTSAALVVCGGGFAVQYRIRGRRSTRLDPTQRFIT